MKKLTIFTTVLLSLSFILSACSGGGNPQTEKKTGKLNVYTTVYPLQYFTERIGGKYVDAKTIYPPGADEHTFEPTQKDMMNLADADLFFYIGLGLEGFVEKSKATLKDQNVTLIPVTNSLKLPKEQGVQAKDKEEHSDINPHVWLDPIYAKEMAAVIENELIKKMPKNKDFFTKNYQALTKDLDELNQKFQTTIDSARTKKMIVSHDAFGYWKIRYGLDLISISGLSTTNEPTQKQLEQIVTTARQDGLHYVLFEQNVNSKLGKIVEDEIGAKSLTLNNLGILTEENIKQKETYFTLMNKNLETLKTALND
ncbi:metal ABC transporter solute-binding protein, Zn/Mn family [Bacillota bacterium Lsc_1132]